MNLIREIPGMVRATIALVLATLAGISSGCRDKDSGEYVLLHAKKAVVSDEGKRITFPEGSPGLLQLATSAVKKGTATIAVTAPGRIVATIAASEESNEKIVLFDSPDVAVLYSQYRQSKANVELTSRNLARVKDMFDNQGATGRDLNQAEADAANAHAVMAETEGKMRAAGFNLADLQRLSSSTAWLLCDVPESELQKVRKNEPVEISIAAIPDTKFAGRADAIGDIVDPATRTVKVRVSLPNPGGKLLPGMFARVDFGEPMNNVIIMPLAAVVTVDSKDYVFVEIASGEFARREVTLVNPGATTGVVLKGLQDGDRIVTTGAMLLKGLSFGY